MSPEVKGAEEVKGIAVMQSVKRLSLAVVVIVFLILCLGFSWLKLMPQSALSFVGGQLGYAISAENIQIQVFSPGIDAENLQVVDSSGNAIASVGQLDVSSTWSVLRGLNTIFDWYQLLQKTHVSISDANLILPDSPLIYIANIDNVDIEKVVNFDVAIKDDNQSFPVVGSMRLSIAESVPHVDINIPSLDLTLLPKSEKEPHQEVEENEQELSSNLQPLLEAFPLKLTLASERIVFSEGAISELFSEITMENGDSVVINHKHSAGLSISLDNEFKLEEEVNLSGSLKLSQNKGHNINNNLSLKIAEDVVNIKNSFNPINQDNSAQINVSLNNVLRQFLSSEQQKLLLPIAGSFSIAVGENSAELVLDKLNLNQSDFSGLVSVGFSNGLSSVDTINYDVKSNLINIPKLDNKADNDRKIKKIKEKPKDNKKLFSEEPFALPKLEGLTANGKLSVENIKYHGRDLLKGFSNHLQLNEDVITLDTQINDFAKGNIASLIYLKDVNSVPRIKLDMTVENILLESLALLPEGEYEGGKTNLKLSLQGAGNSPHNIASSLDGKLLLTSYNGTIANNSFELIGSDLILGILNSINPFHKKVKHTVLECAVINSQIKSGKLLFEDSIAFRTSKMMVVADGEVDLSTEKMNLAINPSARSGVGLDIASLAKFVAIQGTLAEPKIGTSAEGSAKSAVNLAAAISTGGASLLAKNLFDKATNKDICKKALNTF